MYVVEAVREDGHTGKEVIDVLMHYYYVDAASEQEAIDIVHEDRPSVSTAIRESKAWWRATELPSLEPIPDMEGHRIKKVDYVSPGRRQAAKVG